MDNNLTLIEKVVTSITGIMPDKLRNQTIDTYRQTLRKQYGSDFEVVTRSPLVGRCYALKDRIISHNKIEYLLKRAIRRF